MCLHWKGHSGCHVNLEVLLDNVELGSIIKFRNTNDEAVLHLSVDFPRARTHHEHISETALVVIRVYLPNFCTSRVENWALAEPRAPMLVRRVNCTMLGNEGPANFSIWYLHIPAIEIHNS
jgi:hypothetical protein